MSHNRLSAFGVIGTQCDGGNSGGEAEASQSPFGFWGDWNSGKRRGNRGNAR